MSIGFNNSPGMVMLTLVSPIIGYGSRITDLLTTWISGSPPLGGSPYRTSRPAITD
jgi:hypothetical protein